MFGGTKMTLEERVKDLVIKQLGVDPDKVNIDSSFIDDLGADSLDTVELVMAFEEEFDMEISDEDAMKMRTVQDVINYLRDKVSE
jgi:acyl carrier protein